MINGKNFVGIATTYDFVRIQRKHNIIVSCSEDEAQFILYKETLYRDEWLSPVSGVNANYLDVSIEEISEEEYSSIKETLDSGEDIYIEQQQEEEIIIEQPEEDVTVEYIKDVKLAEMSAICNRIIVAGFDAILSDEKVHHFSLSIQDQLNLITLSAMASSGETQIPYHADGELCKLFSVEDITTIVNTATAFKTYHITYYNSLKSYIESMDTIDKISNVTYGMVIPNEYQSDILKSLLS